MREAPAGVGMHREGEESTGRRLYCGFCRKEQGRQGEQA